MSEEKTPLQKADAAILYMLRRIKGHKHLAWYMLATESHHLLMEAAAAIHGKPYAEIEEMFRPAESEDPAGDDDDEDNDCPICGHYEYPATIIQWEESEHTEFFGPYLKLQEALEERGVCCEMLTLPGSHNYKLRIS